jgi:hypothetical protein
LGATLYRLLTGTVPFPQSKYDTAARRMIALVTEAVPSITGPQPDLPEQLAAIVDRMLAKTPADRFSSAQEVAESLAPFAAGADLAAVLRSVRQAADRPEEAGRIADQVMLAAAGCESPRPPADVRAPDSRANGGSQRDAIAKSFRRVPFRIAALAVGLLALVSLIVLGVTVYRLQTANGALLVEVNGAEVSTVMVDGKQILDFKTAGDGKRLQLSLEPGSHSLTLKTADGTDLTTEVGPRPITILAGQQTRIRAWLEAPGDAGTGDAAPAGTELAGPDFSADESVAKWVL